MTLCLVAVLMIGLFFAAASGTAALGKEMSIYELLEHFPMENIDYTYVDKYDGQKHYRTASVWFSPALLLQDARVFSGEMAKSSVALAMAAYHNYYVEQLLVAMGFTVEDNQDVYDRSENELTLQANDYVAYTIAYQDVTYPGTEETYRIYCVPIKGTTENAEWFSNFNIGTGVEHEGFKTASREVYGELLRHFVSDEVDEDHTIVWLTGHSRGAACANLIAGWLSSDEFEQANPEHVFAYTYACPSVSTEADTTLTNIHNFNNPGDLIPLLPLADWDFKRYGQTHILDNSPEQLRNVRQQFSVATGHAYTAESRSTNYEILLTQIFGYDREAFVSSPSNQAILTTVAWFMGGHTDVSLEALLVHLFGEVPDLLVEAVTNIDLVEILGKLLDVNDALTKMITWLGDAYCATIGMTDEEFAKFAEENISMINDVEEMTGMDIYCASALLTAKGIYDYISYDINTALGCVQAAVSLVTDPSGNISDKVAHGHTQSTYVAWINSMYYGYRGWLGNEDLMFFTADENILSIGEECFFRCIGLNTVTMNVPNIYIGNKAFGLCDGLRMVTLPVDCVQEDTPFYETHNVMMIHYTYGRTGVMQDRTDDDSGLLHANTLEFASGNSIRQIYFDEGITHIGRDLFGSGSNSLKLVSLPSTLKSIGDYAFNSCYSLPEIDLPQGLEHIGSHAFSGCTALTEVTFQPGCKSLGNRAFADCSALQKVTLNEDLEEIGGYAFSDCSSLTTLPKLPAGITTISAGMFFNCDGLLQVTIPNTITAIDDEAFNCCSNIETLIIPDSVTTIGSYCFYDCDGLTTLKLPDMAASLGLYAFGSCGGLRTVTLPVDYDFSNDPFRGPNYYDYCDGVTAIYYTPGQSGVMTDRSYDANDGAYYQKTLEYHSRSQITSITFADGITHIGNLLFRDGCNSLTEVKLPSTLKTIGDFAFQSCTKLPVLRFPEGIAAKEMGDTRYYAAYAKLADGTFVYSDAYAYSLKQYAMNMLGKDSTSVKQKALCVAMLNYGAAAQNYFGYRTDDLMNADLTQAQKALASNTAMYGYYAKQYFA